MIDIAKLRKLMIRIEGQKGRFTLFGLFLREDSPGKWDLVLAAPWLEKGKLKALGEFVKEVSETFGEEDILSLSRIVTLNHNDPALQAILKEVGSVGKTLERWGRDLFGLSIEHAYIFRTKQEKIAA